MKTSNTGWRVEFTNRFRMRDAALQGNAVGHGLEGEVMAFVSQTIQQEVDCALEEAANAIEISSIDHEKQAASIVRSRKSQD